MQRKWNHSDFVGDFYILVVFYILTCETERLALKVLKNCPELDPFDWLDGLHNVLFLAHPMLDERIRYD